MYKIRYLLLWLLLASPLLLAGQSTTGSREASQVYRSPAPRPGGARQKPRVRRLNSGPNGEPALPDNAPNPKPASVADRPSGVSFRRRKLRLRERS